MKRALYSATKLNSRDIKKLNVIVFGYPPMICSPLLAKQYFLRQRRPAFTDWETLGRLREKKNCHNKGQQSFLNQSLDAPIPQSKIPGFAPGNVQMIPQNMLSSGYVQTNPDISQAATFYSNRPICVHTKPMNPLTDTALFRNLFPEWFKPLPQEPG